MVHKGLRLPAGNLEQQLVLHLQHAARGLMQLLLAALLTREAGETRRTTHASFSRVAWLLAVVTDQVERLTESWALVEWELLLRRVHLVHVARGAVDNACLRDPTRVRVRSRSSLLLLLLLVERSRAGRARVHTCVPLANDVYGVFVLLDIRLRQRVLAVVLSHISHVLHLFLLTVLRGVLLVQRVRVVLIRVEAGAGVPQESRLRLAHLLRVHCRRSRPRCIILLLVERPLLLLHELLLLGGRDGLAV